MKNCNFKLYLDDSVVISLKGSAFLISHRDCRYLAFSRGPGAGCVATARLRVVSRRNDAQARGELRHICFLLPPF